MNALVKADNITAVLEQLKTSFATPIDDPRGGFSTLRNQELRKAGTFVQSASAISGLTFYDLELGAQLTYPVLTPLRNMMPRVSGKGGIQANWRAITAINPAGLRIGVSPANRGGIMTYTEKDFIAVYKGIGIETSVDFEAQYAGQGFDDIRALAAKIGLEGLMIGEEQMILGGNGGMQLGTTPTPSAVPGSGGTLANQTLSVICVALSLDGMVNAPTNVASAGAGIAANIVRTNADGTIDTFGGGAAQKSVNGTATVVAGPTGSVTATVAVVSGAFGYAWFWGPVGSEVLGAVTTINSVLITALATGTQTAASLPLADWSVNNLAFSGLTYLALTAGSGAYLATQATGTAGVGTPLTADGAGGIVEIDLALKSFWDNFRLSPDTIWVNSQEALNISKKILAGNANAAQRFVFSVNQGDLAGGIMVRTYLNRFSMGNAAGAGQPMTLDIKIHPNMPAGSILFTTKVLPYPMSGVGNINQIRCRQDYYQIEWPLLTRKYEYGIYSDEVLQNYFPPSLGVITNIGNG